MLVNLYGWLLAAGTAATSLAMMLRGGRFQLFEAAA
jgi:hypothetical protein